MVSRLNMMLRLTFISMVFINVQVPCLASPLTESLLETLQVGSSLIKKMYNFSRFTKRNKEDFMPALRSLPIALEKFYKTPLTDFKVDVGFLNTIANMHVQAENYGRMILYIKAVKYIKNEQYSKLLSNSYRFEHHKSDDRFVRHLDDGCKDVKYDEVPIDISVNSICSSVDTCGNMNKWACTEPGKKCNVVKAVPMMYVMLYFKMTNWIVERLCPKRCKTGKCKVKEHYEKLIYETKLLTTYATIMKPNNWSTKMGAFLKDITKKSAYSNIDVAMSTIDDYRNIFDVPLLACNVLKYTQLCPYADIWNAKTLLKKSLQNINRPRLVKDLKMLQHVNAPKMLELQKSFILHLRILASIKNLDDNLQVSVAKISDYFQGLAKFDKGIANADALFISAELTKYEKSSGHIELKLKKDIQSAMDAMKIVLGANVAEEIVQLGLIIATNSNPLKIMFTGPDLKEIAEQAAELANAGAELARGKALLDSFAALAESSMKISEAFGRNDVQLTSIKSVVEKIRNGKANDIGADGDKFVKEYGDYTPQTDRSALAKNNALWSATKDATCALLFGETGIGGAIPKGIAGANLICEKLEGTLAQFFILREDIFDFQFRLVDAVARVVRGNIAKRLAQNIKGKGDLLHGRQLLLGSIMAQIMVQSTASIYCDILEYQQHGKRIQDCSPAKGLFKEKDINILIAYEDKSTRTDIVRDVTIPARARYDGDIGFIDLPALARGETVVFRPPSDTKWLLKNGWILAAKSPVPFIKSFELYLPHKKYKTGAERQQTTTVIKIESIGKNSVTTVSPNTATAYILPKGHGTYLTVYKEGYTDCLKEMKNPYSLCDNLPKICHSSTTIPGKSILPTVLTTWKLSVAIRSRSGSVTYDAPTPATNMLVRARVSLNVKNSDMIRRSNVALFRKRVNDGGCCKGNMYRADLYTQNNCKSCPKNSISALRGYYCEVTK